MRPIQITMQAFGSYAAKETVDFTKTRQNLFLVFGDTGSGKSTIFDAIVFALYGEAGSEDNKRNGEELQSQFADKDVPPFVELEFEEKGERYTVRREPRHFRKKAKTRIPERVSLTKDDGTEFALNTKDTNAKLEELVGLTKHQFMQVAMIAQGEFVKLLRASSDDRKTIFRKLFNTEIFNDLVLALYEKKKEKEAELGKVKAEFWAQIGQLELSAEDGETADTAALRDKILSAKDLSVVDVEQLLQNLKTVLEARKERLRGETAAVTEAEARKDSAHDALTVAENLRISYESLDRAEAALRQCEDEGPKLEKTAALLRQIEAALAVKNAHDNLKEAENTLYETEEKHLRQQNELPVLTAAQAETHRETEEKKSTRDAELRAYSGVEERVNAAVKVFAEIEAARAELTEARTAAEAAAEEKTAAEAALNTLEQQEKLWNETVRDLTDAPSQLENCKARTETAKGFADELKNCTAREQELQEAFAKAETAATAYVESDRNWREKNTEYSALQEAFLNAQAGILAREKLHPGQPCPVCGSTEHPAPCLLPETAAELKQETVNTLKAEADELLKIMQTASAASQTANAAYEADKKNLELQKSKLRRDLSALLPTLPAEADVPEMEKLLKTLMASLKKEKSALEEKVKTLTQTRNALADAESKKSECKNALEEKAKAAERAGNRVAGAESALAQLMGAKTYDSEQAAKDELSTAEARKTAAQNAAQAAETKENDAAAALQNAKALIAEYEATLPKQRETVAARRETYLNTLAEKGADAENWQETAERHTAKEIPMLRSELEEGKDRRSNAQAQKNAALEQISGRQRPDAELLTAQSEAAQAAWEAAKAARDADDVFVSRNNKVYAALEPKMEERARLAEYYNRICRLHGAIGGKNTGEKMDLETYVQRHYLERALYNANIRFREMSAGQYELRLCPFEIAGEGKNRGLDLMVHSFVTGQTREISTLSGGESFMAALSLALGMSDQIRASSASVQLDMMFIDEGFGSLDENSRKQAIRVLKDMAGSSRLIGIISHVSELKQEIDDQLLVSKNEQGSHAVWQLS